MEINDAISDYFNDIFSDNLVSDADKAPGLDDFNPGFYQEFWIIIRQ